MSKWLIEIIYNKSREFPGSQEISKKIPDFRDCHLGPGLEALIGFGTFGPSNLWLLTKRNWHSIQTKKILCNLEILSLTNIEKTWLKVTKIELLIYSPRNQLMITAKSATQSVLLTVQTASINVPRFVASVSICMLLLFLVLDVHLCIIWWCTFIV